MSLSSEFPKFRMLDRRNQGSPIGVCCCKVEEGEYMSGFLPIGVLVVILAVSSWLVIVPSLSSVVFILVINGMGGAFPKFIPMISHWEFVSRRVLVSMIFCSSPFTGTNISGQSRNDSMNFVMRDSYFKGPFIFFP